jgi:glyoxylase I family protein
MIRFEHTAYNVAEPEKVADWYAKTFDMDIVRSSKEGFRPHFVADKQRRFCWEFYCRGGDPIVYQRGVSAWSQHVAFTCDDMMAERERLVAAGGTADGDVTRFPNGDAVCYVRDPWGLTIQLVHRATPLY